MGWFALLLCLLCFLLSEASEAPEAGSEVLKQPVCNGGIGDYALERIVVSEGSKGFKILVLKFDGGAGGDWVV